MNLSTYIVDYVDASGAVVPLSPEHRARRAKFSRAWKYYSNEGGGRPNLAKLVKGEEDGKVNTNWTKKIVNSSNRFLFGKPLTFTAGDDAQQKIVDEFWKNDPLRGFVKKSFDFKVGQYGAVTGTPFVRLFRTESGPPRISVIDSSMMDVVIDPMDRERVVSYLVCWKAGKFWYRQKISRAPNDSWSIADEIYARGDWRAAAGGPDNSLDVWPYSFAPVLHCQNLVNARSIWGFSEADELDLVDETNKVNTDIGKTLKLYAHPQTIVTGTAEDGRQLDKEIGAMWLFSSPDAKAYNLEMASDMASSRAHVEALQSDLHQVSDTAELSAGEVNLGALSGVALRILYGPALAKNSEKQDLYGGLYAQINRAVLEMSGVKDPLPVQNVWGDPLPKNPKETAELFDIYAPHIGIEEAAIVSGHTSAQVEVMTGGEEDPR